MAISYVSLILYPFNTKHHSVNIITLPPNAKMHYNEIYLNYFNSTDKQIQIFTATVWCSRRYVKSTNNTFFLDKWNYFCVWHLFKYVFKEEQLYKWFCKRRKIYIYISFLFLALIVLFVFKITIPLLRTS